MANECLPQVRACRARIAQLDASGVPQPGAGNVYTSKIIEMTMTPVTSTSPGIEQRDACGDMVVNVPEEETVTRYGIDLMVSNPDPEMSELLAGGLTETVATAGAYQNAVGYGAPALGAIGNPNGVSIELWALRIEDGVPDSDLPYMHWVFPRVKGIRFGPRRFFNGVLENPFVGYAIENPNWFNGPLNTWPISSDRAFHYIPTRTLPDVTCGSTTLAAS